MATRMQQRRGTASQWTAANPTLEAGEIGFESDTSKFKIGDGVNQWADLEYFINQAAIEVDVSGAIADSEKGAANGVATLDGASKLTTSQIPTTVALLANPTFTGTPAAPTANAGTNTTQIATTAFVQAEIGNLIDSAPSALNTLNELAAALNDNADFGSVVTGTLSAHDLSIQGAEGNITALLGRMTTAEGDIDTLQSDLNTAEANLGNAVSDIGTINSDIASLQSDLGTVTNDFSAHALETVTVHGISDTANLVYTADSRLSDSRTPTVHASSHADGGSDELTLAQSQITGLETALDGKASLSGATFTGTVNGISKSMVGLGNVDNTSDADKPVSTATQTALDLKANLAGPTFTGTATANDLVVNGDFTVNGTNFAASATTITIEDNLVQLAHQNAANTVDLGVVVAYNDGSAKHAGIARDVSENKWKLFKGVSTEPTTTVAFSEGSLDTLAVDTLEASTVTLSGTSLATTLDAKADKTTPIITKSANYTIASGDVNDIIEVSAAATITIPADNSFWPTGQRLEIIQTGSGQVTIAGGSGVTVNGTPGTKTRAQWSGATIIKRSANMFVVLGDLSA